METKISLLPNSELILIKRKNGNIGIYIKEGIINENNPILEINPDSTYLEEVQSGDKNKTILVKISPKAKSNQEYILAIINVDLLTKRVSDYEIVSQKEPQKLSPYIYLTEEEGYGMSIRKINKRPIKDQYGRIEKGIKEIFNQKIDNIKLSCFDPKKNPNIYELIINFGNIETLHMYLKIDGSIEKGIEKSVEIYNTFYSEMAAGKGYLCVEDKSGNEYIDFITFFNKLSDHSIIEEIDYISWWKKECEERENRSIEDTKNKIRKKVWPMIPRIENK